MDRKWLFTLRAFSICTGLVLSSSVLAAPSLQEYLLNINGDLYHDTTSAPGVDASGFDTETGLGSLVINFAPGVSGAFNIDVFFDHELHTPFFNEFGTVSGIPTSGMTWQIDEPELGSDLNRSGTIFTNTANSTLDSINYVPGTTSNFLNDCGANGGGVADASCNNDVAMALGFSFALAAGEHATIAINASQIAPPSGFVLQQHDPDARADNLFLFGSIEFSSVPEPQTLLLVGVGLASIFALRARLVGGSA